jgi:hypothetical protein
MHRRSGAARLSVSLPVLMSGLLLAWLVSASAVGGATPTSAGVGPANGSRTAWDFAPVGPGVSSGGTVEFACAPVYCDPFQLDVSLPAPDQAFYVDHIATLTITYTWTSTTANDMDVFAFAPDGTESGPGSPDDASTGAGVETLTIANPASGAWTIESHVGVTPAATPAHAVAELTYQQVAPPPQPVLGGSAPSFIDASPPLGYQSVDVLRRENAGEPSIGINRQTGAVMYMAGTQVSRVTFGSGSTAATWTDVTPTQQTLANEDAILFTDPVTHRTFITGLLVAGSNGDFSNDDGASWTPMTFPVPHSPDHESVGGGSYSPPAPALAGSTGYPNGVYYCSQNILQAAGAFCGRSDTGGLTFNPSTVAFGTTSPCGSIHGHIKVAPDGTVYIPQNNCKRADGLAGQGMAISRDNGQTWSYSTVPDSTAKPSNTGTDPSIGIGAQGSVYFGYEAGDGHPRIAVSHDHGATWSASVDVGLPYGIQNSKFPEVVAGDDGRAAFAFLGTTSGGNDQSAVFPGVWYLYVAFTYDGGLHWQTVNATPGNPVQRGCIWNGGGSNACRNLLDFNDIGLDANGRVLIAYTDGCKNIDFSYSSITGEAQGVVHGPSKCDTDPNAYADTDKVNFDGLARQSCGESLFAAFDPGISDACPPPAIIQVQPFPGATGVPTSVRPSASFDEIVSSGTLTLTDPLGRAVKGAVSCNSPCTTVVFTPNSRLKANTTYTARASGSNSAGSGSYTWGFTTSR